MIYYIPHNTTLYNVKGIVIADLLMEKNLFLIDIYV